MTMARGNVLRGSTTSPAIVGASSRPAKPKQRLAKKRSGGSCAKSGASVCAVVGVGEPQAGEAETEVGEEEKRRELREVGHERVRGDRRGRARGDQRDDADQEQRARRNPL